MKVGSLSVGWQQRVEILKALYRDAKILVLDEPTAVLTPQETEEIFVVLRNLATQGHSIIFISHKLNEVLEIADRITVIRRGKVVGERVPTETDEGDLAELMVGREVLLVVDRGESNPGATALKVSGLGAKDDRDTTRCAESTSRSERARSSVLPGSPVTVRTSWSKRSRACVERLREPSRWMARTSAASPRQIYESGVAYVPADRQRFGSVLSFPLTDNLALTDYYRPPYARGILRNDAAIDQMADERIKSFDIRTRPRRSGPRHFRRQSAEARRGTRVGTGSAAVDPRSTDARTRRRQHRVHPSAAIAKRNAGTAILLISAELDEVLELSDRIVVMYRGRIVGTFDGRTADRNEVGLLMATGGRERADDEGGGTAA